MTPTFKLWVAPMKADANRDIDRVVEIERLAELDLIDYDVARVEAAKRLGIRASVLDRIVAAKRRELGLDGGNDNDEKGQGHAVKINDVLPWHEPVDGDRIATTLAAIINTHTVLSDVAADVVALWALYTWVVDSFTISPRLAITSPTKGCGKTTLLRVLYRITRRPQRVGSITPAALFRLIELARPTVLLDETEKYLEDNSDTHALLNEGHAKGSEALRVLGESNELRAFYVFCAVAFCRNGRLPDDLEQRSVVIEMKRRRAEEPLSELREDRPDQFLDVAKMCARWAEDNAALLVGADPDMGTINRNADNWRPLFAIADLIGADWPQRIREAAALLMSRESESVGPMLLADIRDIFDQRGTDRLASAEICEALASIEGRPWAEWKASKGSTARPLSPNQLARLLRPFGIVTNLTIRIGQKTAKGYQHSQFEEVWARYIADHPPDDRSQGNNACAAGISATFRKVTPDDDVTDRKCEKPPSDGACYRVTDQKGDNGPAQANAEPNGPAEPPPTREPDLSIPDFLRRPPGLSWREIDRLATEVGDWVHARRDQGDISQSALEDEIRRRLAGTVLPEAVEIELERVTRSLFDTEEARRAHPA
jgi:putative DNA primase/helicase